MAHCAILGRRQVIDQLADRDHIVMTGLAVIDDTGMIECTRGERARGVAHTAVIAGWHMVDRFADRSDTVAGGAVIHDAAVVKRRTEETGGVMTDAAIFGGRNMGG